MIQQIEVPIFMRIGDNQEVEIATVATPGPIWEEAKKHVATFLREVADLLEEKP